MQILMFYVISLRWIHFETWAKIKLWFVVVALLSIGINLLTVNSITTERKINSQFAACAFDCEAFADILHALMRSVF